MKKTYSEQKALKKLGISDFGEMTKEKAGKFTSMIPKMDPEVAKKAMEQFPMFKELGTEVLSNIKLSIENVLSSNSLSQQEVYQGYRMVLESLEKELEQDSISCEERRVIEDKMISIVNQMAEKDSENKKFLEKMAATGTGIGIALLGLASIAIGVRWKSAL